MRSRPKIVRPEIANEIVDLMGGNSVVSKMCEVTPQAVSQWRKSGMPIYRFRLLCALKKEIRMKYKKAGGSIYAD